MNEPASSAPYHPYRAQPAYDLPPHPIAVPYDGQTRMRLAIASGLSSARVRIDPDARELVTINPGGGLPPHVRAGSSEVRLAWSSSFGEWLRCLFDRAHDVEIVLHPAVAWELVVHGGLSDLEIDLTAGLVSRIEVTGGCSEVEITLPRPPHAVPIRISGGASRLRVRRPADVGVSVEVRGGVASLRLDDRGFDAIGGSARLETGACAPGDPRYDVQVSGGACDLDIDGSRSLP